MAKEVLPSMCPPGFWFRFNLVRLVLCLWLIRFSFVDSWARDKGLFLDDHVTLWSDSNPSSLVLKPAESRVPLIRSFWVLEKTPFLLGNSSIPPKPWSDLLILSVDMFTSPFVIMHTNFGEIWTWFGLSIVEFFKNRGQENSFLGADWVLPITG